MIIKSRKFYTMVEGSIIRGIVHKQADGRIALGRILPHVRPGQRYLASSTPDGVVTMVPIKGSDAEAIGVAQKDNQPGD